VTALHRRARLSRHFARSARANKLRTHAATIARSTRTLKHVLAGTPHARFATPLRAFCKKNRRGISKKNMAWHRAPVFMILSYRSM